MKKYIFFITITTISFFYSSCNKINLLTLEDEKQLGLQSKQQIAQDPTQFPPLPRSGQYLQAYQMLESMRDQILNSGQIQYKNDFAWEIQIINDPNTLNAFCTPGGYIYFYTGLLKYLDNSSAVAGVMGHEMAHADRRHSGKQITTAMGLDLVLQIVSGTAGAQIGQVVNIAAGLTSLKFSRDAETEADGYSVKYLCPTQYQTNGASYFFQKLIDNGQAGGTPAFLSTHPDPGSRVENITKEANGQTGCGATKLPFAGDNNYLSIRATLP